MRKYSLSRKPVTAGITKQNSTMACPISQGILKTFRWQPNARHLEKPLCAPLLFEAEAKNDTFSSAQVLSYTEGRSCFVKMQPRKFKDPPCLLASPWVNSIVRFSLGKSSTGLSPQGARETWAVAELPFASPGWLWNSLLATPHQPRKPIGLSTNPPPQFSYTFILFPGSTKVNKMSTQIMETPRALS